MTGEPHGCGEWIYPAKQAFAELVAKAPLHPDQISSLNEVIEYLVKNGAVQPKELHSGRLPITMI